MNDMRPRIAWLSALAVTATFGAAPAPAQQVVRLGEGQTLTISGLVSATLFRNRSKFGGFGQGQNAEWAAQFEDTTDASYLDGDVRNTRLRFEFSGSPVLGKWAPRAVIESDFFGQQGLLPFGDEQPQLRVRLAHVDLTNGRTTLRIGQFWSPLFGAVPASLSHIAFPLGYGAGGKIGWRFPGVFLYHDLNPGKPVVVQLQLAAFEGSGPFRGGNGPDSVNSIGTGEASGLPQLEALLNFSKRSGRLTWNAYVVGHIDWKDTSGTNRGGENQTGTGFEAGGNITRGRLTLQGNVFYAKRLGQQFAHITQQGNIQGSGGWVQVGYDFTPRWGLWGFYGVDDPDEDQFAQDNAPAVLPRQKNEDAAVMLRFRAGRYALGLEWFRAMTQYPAGWTDADQVALSVLYTL
jgi:hypothetical protein